MEGKPREGSPCEPNPNRTRAGGQKNEYSTPITSPLGWSQMSAVGIGLAWAFITIASFVALSASALARSSHELEADPRGLHGGTHWPAGRAAWPALETPPASPVLRSSPSVVHMHPGSSPPRLEPLLSS